MLIILAVVAIFTAPGLKTLSNPATQGIDVSAGSLRYVQFLLNESGAIILTFNATTPVDMYMTNATAFAQIMSASALNYGRSEALSLSGLGVYEIYENSTTGDFPYTNFSGIAKPVYLQNASLLGNGTYYAIFANARNGSVVVNVTSLTLSTTELRSSIGSIGLYVLGAFVAFIAGIGFIIFSFLSKGGKQKQDMAMDKEVEKEYDRIEKKGKK